MRKILLTLLTTLLCINTEVMAEDFTITPIYTGSYLSPGNLVKVTLSSASVSSGSIQVSKNATGSFTISVNNAPNMYLKSATFTDSQYGTNKQATVSCTSGGTVTDNGSGTYTFTPTNSTTTSATIQLVGNTGGAAKITSLSVIVTNGSTNNMETLSGFSISSGTYSFTSKINGSTVSSSVTLTTETASSWGVNAYNSIAAPSSSDTKTITIASDNAIKYIALQDSACRISLVELTSTGGTVSGASWKAPAEGAVKSVTFKNGIGSSVNNVFKIYVVTESSCTSITPTLSYASVGGTTLAIGGSSSGSPTVGGNTGSGAVTYAITATPSGCATINNSTGVVTGVHAGTATVTATVAANGDYCSGTATADFTISCNSITPTFSTDYTSTTLTVGGGTSSTPDVNKDGSSGAISWTSSAPAKATVNSSGVVTPVAAGSATITATVAANGDYCEGSVSKNFTINAAACSPSISVSPASANYCKDDDATALSFTGSGHNAQKWQYYDGDSWEDIDGATNATFTPSTSATGSTQYRVVTTCDSYTTTATSSAATVTVKTSPGLTITLN